VRKWKRAASQPRPFFLPSQLGFAAIGGLAVRATKAAKLAAKEGGAVPSPAEVRRAAAALQKEGKLRGYPER
jgi:hypothetical protein